MHVHELRDRPRLRPDTDRLVAPHGAVRHRQGRLVGRMESWGFGLCQEAVLRALTADVLNGSEIEGEELEADPGRSSAGLAWRSVHWRQEVAGSEALSR